MKKATVHIFLFCLVLLEFSCGNKVNTTNNTVPNAPINITGNAVSSNTVQLNWSDNSANEDAFDIFRKDSTIWSIAASIPFNSTSYTDSLLHDTTIYKYFVVARNAFGSSTPSDTITVVTRAMALYFLGEYHTVENARAVSLTENNIYIAAGSGGLYILNRNNPQNPSLVNHYSEPGINVIDIYMYQNYAFLADFSLGFRILNISNPDIPILYNIFGPVYGTGICVRRITDFLYAFSIDWASDSGFSVTNITDPLNPYNVGNYDAYLPTSIDVDGNYAYIGLNNGGLNIIQISQPTNPIYMGSWYEQGTTVIRDIQIVGNNAFAATNNGLQILDISDISNPISIAIAQTPNEATGVFVSNNYAFISAGNSGIRVFNISDLSMPSIVASYNTPGYADKICVGGNYVYVADGNSGLQILRFQQ